MPIMPEPGLSEQAAGSKTDALADKGDGRGFSSARTLPAHDEPSWLSRGRALADAEQGAKTLFPSFSAFAQHFDLQAGFGQRLDAAGQIPPGTEYLAVH